VRVYGSGEAVGAFVAHREALKDAEIKLLRDRCAELEHERDDLRDQLAGVRELRKCDANDFRDQFAEAQRPNRCDACDCDLWLCRFCTEKARKRDRAAVDRAEKRELKALRERDAAIKRSSDREIECGRLEGRLETMRALLAVARASARRLWRFCLSWAPTNDAWREIKHETQAEAGDWINE